MKKDNLLITVKNAKLCRNTEVVLGIEDKVFGGIALKAIHESEYDSFCDEIKEYFDDDLLDSESGSHILYAYRNCENMYKNLSKLESEVMWYGGLE